jgi:peptidoglycan/LPS O-acetylase OafA/YrhL
MKPSNHLVSAQAVQGHIREIDGLRGIAIALVMVHHFWPGTRWAELAHLGWIGVDLFFVISGFLITGILLDTREEPAYFRNFYARRALRIFPLYYLFLTAAFVIIPLAEAGPYLQTAFLRESGSPWWYYLYGGNLREAITGTEPAYILAPLWSLSIEEQFYITFPVVVFLLPPRTLRFLLLALIVVAPIFRTATALAWPMNERIQYLATISRMDVIALGGLIAVSHRMKDAWLPSRRTTARLFAVALVVLAVTFCLSGLNRMTLFCRTVGYSLVAGTFALMVLWAVQNRGAAATSLLRVAPLVRLGTICYGVYLLQRPAEVLFGRVVSRSQVPIDLDSFAGMAGKCAAAILLATLSWFFFEKPILGFKRHFLRGLRSPRDGGPGAVRRAGDGDRIPQIGEETRADASCISAVAQT